MTSRTALLNSLTFLGTSSGVPTPFRNVSGSCLSFTDGGVWLFDCGEGTQHQLQKASNVSAGKVQRIFVTHMHGDHCYGLPGFMCSMSMHWQRPGIVAPPSEYEAFFANPQADPEDYTGPWYHDWFSKESQYLELVGPQGLGEFLRTVLRTSEAGFGYKYRVTELRERPTDMPDHISVGSESTENLFTHEANPQYLYPDKKGQYHVLAPGPDTSGVEVKACKLGHRVFCLGYAVTEATSPGALDMAKVAQLGVPKGPLLGKLKGGEPVTFTPAAKGEAQAEITVSPSDCVGDPVPGRTILMLGDTCESSLCHGIAQGCDFLIHEATFDDANEHLALPRGHSTSRMAGKFAKKLEAKNLILTHFSARFPPIHKDPEPIERLIAQAAEEVDPQRTVVHAAEDFRVFDLSRKAAAKAKGKK